MKTVNIITGIIVTLSWGYIAVKCALHDEMWITDWWGWLIIGFFIAVGVVNIWLGLRNKI